MSHEARRVRDLNESLSLLHLIDHSGDSSGYGSDSRRACVPRSDPAAPSNPHTRDFLVASVPWFPSQKTIAIYLETSEMQ